MRRLIAPVLLVWLAQAAPAAMVTGAAGAGGAFHGPLFAPASSAWNDSFAGFGRWLETPAGFAARAQYPFLGRLPGLTRSPEALAAAVAPMAAALPEAAQARLADMAALAPAARAEALADVEKARLAAAPEVERRASAVTSSLRKEEDPSADTLSAAAGQLRPLSFYSQAARHEYRVVRVMATLRAMRLAGDGAKALKGLDWDADDYTPAVQDRPPVQTQGRAKGPYRYLLLPALPALPPSAFYDAAHWTGALIPDRAYARRLEAAADLLSAGDKAESPAAAADLQARERLVATLRDEDPRIYSHMMRVGLMAGLIAARLGFDAAYVQRAAWAARVHDIGKRAPDILAVVNKEGRLTPEERAVMERHPEEGTAIIAADEALGPLSRRAGMRAALNHHETMDGTGYPRRLTGDAIPMESRITSVADFFDALMENRPYRKGMTTAEALAVMEKAKDKFDPAVWKAFLGVMAVPAPAQA